MFSRKSSFRKVVPQRREFVSWSGALQFFADIRKQSFFLKNQDVEKNKLFVYFLPEAMNEEELKRNIHETEEKIREKERTLMSKKKLLADGQKLELTGQELLIEAERALESAEQKYKNAEQEREMLLPQYERSQQNKDHHAKAEQYKVAISEAEEKLRHADGKIKELEQKLQQVSATYKNAREKRMLMVAKVNAHVDELREAVENKIALTLPIDDAVGEPDALHCLKRLAEVNRERELSIAHWSRHKEELNAIIDMKRHRAIELKLEAERNVALMKAARDEEIRLLVERFEEERNNLQSDIASVKANNAAKLEALRKTMIMSDTAVLMEPDPPIPGKPSSKSSHSRRETATTSEKLLAQKVKDLENEKSELHQRIRHTSSERQKLIQATKELRKQIDFEEERFTATLRSFENQVQNEKNELSALEHENSRLEEICENLAATLKGSLAVMSS